MIDQLFIALFGVPAIFLTQSKRANWRRYACLFGVAGQPFWIWMALAHHQYGVLVLCGLYGAAWCKGVWQEWLSPRERRRREFEACTLDAVAVARLKASQPITFQTINTEARNYVINEQDLADVWPRLGP